MFFEKNMLSSFSLAFLVFYHAFSSQKTCFSKNVFSFFMLFLVQHIFGLIEILHFLEVKKSCVFACFFWSMFFIFFMRANIFFCFSFIIQRFSMFSFCVREVWVECFVQVRQLLISFWQLLMDYSYILGKELLSEGLIWSRMGSLQNYLIRPPPFRGGQVIKW